jgi:hypothetical protein
MNLVRRFSSEAQTACRRPASRSGWALLPPMLSPSCRAAKHSSYLEIATRFVFMSKGDHDRRAAFHPMPSNDVSLDRRSHQAKALQQPVTARIKQNSWTIIRKKVRSKLVASVELRRPRQPYGYELAKSLVHDGRLTARQ